MPGTKQSGGESEEGSSQDAVRSSPQTSAPPFGSTNISSRARVVLADSYLHFAARYRFASPTIRLASGELAPHGGESNQKVGR